MQPRQGDEHMCKLQLRTRWWAIIELSHSMCSAKVNGDGDGMVLDGVGEGGAQLSGDG